MPRLRILRFSLICVSALALVAAIALTAPYWYAEYGLRQHGERVAPRPSIPVRGRWFDDYYVVQTLDATTYAIGEPRYYQGNFSYLILGTKAAVLFDGGTGSRDIVPVVRSLTALPVTVVPSHLHFDHVGGLGRFDKTALLDDPDLRSRVADCQELFSRADDDVLHCGEGAVRSVSNARINSARSVSLRAGLKWRTGSNTSSVSK